MVEKVIIAGLAAGAFTVLVCTSKLGGWVRRLPYLNQVANCCFCTSWWISVAMIDRFSIIQWAATVAVANITVLLIHLGIATVGEQDEVVEQLGGSEELQQCMAESRPSKVSCG